MYCPHFDCLESLRSFDDEASLMAHMRAEHEGESTEERQMLHRDMDEEDVEADAAMPPLKHSPGVSGMRNLTPFVSPLTPVPPLKHSPGVSGMRNLTPFVSPLTPVPPLKHSPGVSGMRNLTPFVSPLTPVPPQNGSQTERVVFRKVDEVMVTDASLLLMGDSTGWEVQPSSRRQGQQRQRGSLTDRSGPRGLSGSDAVSASLKHDDWRWGLGEAHVRHTEPSAPVRPSKGTTIDPHARELWRQKRCHREQLRKVENLNSMLKAENYKRRIAEAREKGTGTCLPRVIYRALPKRVRDPNSEWDTTSRKLHLERLEQARKSGAIEPRLDPEMEATRAAMLDRIGENRKEQMEALQQQDADRRIRLATIQPMVSSKLTDREHEERTIKKVQRMNAQRKKHQDLHEANRLHKKRVGGARIRGGLAQHEASEQRAKEVARECAAKAAMALEEETKRLKQVYEDACNQRRMELQLQRHRLKDPKIK